jgi:hemoglobin/transferrin/lactoferrin receptor protein
MIAVAALLAAGSHGAWGFEGRVVDRRTGSPVAGATVTIAGRSGTARTDGDGRFLWQPDPPTPFEIVVVLPGGDVARPALVERIDHAAVTTITVEAILHESVTVVGVAPSIDATPAAGTTLLSGAQIERRNPANLMQALETVPGVSQVSEGQAAVPAIRGLARGRSLILIDGARVSSERRVGPSATYLDPGIVEGIDVARGPGSVAYGSDALGGVISLRTRSAEPGSPLRARLVASAGTGVPDRRGSIEVTRGFETGGILLEAHGREAEDYEGPDGREVFNSGWSDSGLLLRFDRQLGGGDFSAGYQGDFARDAERPRSNSSTVRFYYPYENSHRLTASHELSEVAGFEKVAFTGFYGRYEQRTDQDRFSAALRTIERADVSADDFHVRGTAERIAGPARIEFGVDANGRTGLEANEIRIAYDEAGEIASEETMVAIADASRLDTGAFAQAQASLSRVVLVSVGARADRVATRNHGGYFGDRSTSNSALSGFGAVSAGPFRGCAFTAQASWGFRDPTLSDRYYRGPSGRGYITGNPDLEPETSEQLDLALRYAAGPARVAAYAYRYSIEDLVERYASEENPDDFYFRNRGRALLRGVELELQAALPLELVLEVAGQVERGITTDDGADLDDVPADSIAATLRKEFGGRGFVQGRVARFDRDDRPGPTENPAAAPGYTLVDLSGGWRFKAAVELRAQVRNALDEEYWASPDPRWVPAPGRSASLTAVVLLD